MDKDTAPQKSMDESKKENKESKSFKLPNFIRKYTVKIFVVLIGAAICLGGLFIYRNYQKTKNELSKYKDDPNVLAFKEKYDLLGKVSNHVVLPAGEDPTIATITNSHRLAGQAFFTHAENGDKIIIFPISGRAILYRPSIDKIIEAAPVNITDMQKSVDTNAIEEEKDDKTGNVEGAKDVKQENKGQENVEDDAKESAETAEAKNDKEDKDGQEVIPLQIGVLNSTDVAGLASDTANLVSDSLNSKALEIDVISVDNSVDVYSTNIIFYIEEEHKQYAQEIANLIGGTITTEFPENEEEFNGDILVIRGNSD